MSGNTIFMFHIACADGDIRLLNETSDFSNSLSTFQGQVVVCVGGAYQPVCDIGWDNNDARGACVLRYGSRFGKRRVLSKSEYVRVKIIFLDTSFICLPKIVPRGQLLSMRSILTVVVLQMVKHYLVCPCHQMRRLWPRM